MISRIAALFASIAASAALLTGCATPNPADYAAQAPRLDLKSYFDGELLAHGMFSDRWGRVQRRFVATIQASWQGPEGVLDERFTWSDGKSERRVWRITDTGGGRYVGRADDVVGEAVGIASGPALNWRYTMRLPVDDKIYEVQFDDGMFLVDERVLLNRAVMSKFGIRLGEVTISFTKR